jgi:hypothetical protein
LLLAAPPVMANEIVNPRVNGNTLQAEIEAGAVSASLTIQFENVVGLTPTSLGLSVQTIQLLDASLLARLGSGVSVPAEFPVLLKVEPSPASGLSFGGIVSIELYTHALQYVPGTSLRMFSARSGEAFSDITTSAGSGSYRSGGTKGEFSEFIIVTDLRTAPAVITAKYAALADLLAGYAGQIDDGVRAELEGLHGASQQAWQSDARVAAIQYIEAFAAKVVEHSGDAIPDVWRSAGDLDNLAGELRAKAATLRFSLTLASNTL